MKIEFPPYRSDLADERLREAFSVICSDKDPTKLVEDLYIATNGSVVFVDREHFDGMCREVRRAYGHK